MNIRKTKIMATLGPSTDHINTLTDLMLAGMDIVRLNMSHGNFGVHANRLKDLMYVAKKHHKHLDICVDLPGPKVRIGKFVNQKVHLKANNQFILDPDLDENSGTEQAVKISYSNLYQDLNNKDILLLDDGKIALEVELINSNKIICLIKTSGYLSDNKGLSLQGGGLSADALTSKDQEAIIFIAQFKIDLFAISFVKTASDIIKIRKIIQEAHSKAKVFAKIETKKAIENLEEIIKEADGIMVARGDLGVELGLAVLPGLQKYILKIANKYNKPAIVATGIMDSMIEHSTPTRAEVMDIANSILDGAKIIAFSAETAIGKNPVLVVKYANDICIEAEKLLSKV